jgi:hypothetical protein
MPRFLPWVGPADLEREIPLPMCDVLVVERNRGIVTWRPEPMACFLPWLVLADLRRGIPRPLQEALRLPPPQRIPWADVALDVQRLIVRACSLETRARLARTCRANVRFAPGAPPRPLRAILDAPRPSLGRTRVVSFALQEFEMNRMLRHACLFLRVQITFDYDGGITVDGCFGGSTLRIRAWADALCDPHPRRLDVVLAFRFSDALLIVRWPTIRDFILDPERFE